MRRGGVCETIKCASAMKSQASTPRLQRNYKSQAPTSLDGNGASNTAIVSSGLFLLSDAPAGDRVHRHAFDLEERTARFGEAVIYFVKKTSRGPVNDRLIGQFVGCGTSIGANYCEANEAVSKKDFKCTIGRCVKEAKETKFFLRMIAASEPRLADEARQLYREAKELHLIFASMYRK
jgi:four helix bundle protein